jgi:hypothetical protein
MKKTINSLPSYVQRIDDGELFVLSEDGQYYLKMMLDEFSHKHLFQGCSLETLLSHGNNIFRVVDGSFGPRTDYTAKG